MPTIGTQPTLEATQAVGAILLREFARDRFREASLDENLIEKAEEREHLTELTASLATNELNNTTSSTLCNESTASNTSASNLNNGSQQVGVANGNLETSNSEQFHSVLESSTSNGNTTTTTQINDRTLYHSINTSHDSSCAPTSQERSQLQTANLAMYGQELRRIAEEFEKSRLRQTVKDRAEKVNLSEITKESFVDLLEELFQGEITRERIVILFFFCTDIALRAASFAQELVVKLLGWSFSYIINTVCSLIHKLGGWDKVLFYQLPSILISCCAALAIVSLLVFLKKSLRG